ncbi:4996_t:CDS:2 [Diversispora eburnea]|uniref:4996_t:CDS:1 n=1 Tax=Diversispora eburnea TaxID=1213867 RepID=A0A9N9AKA0_9GLOM|nr:4996_t:CDS:2 [Diversispora eburnea]
MSQSTEIPPRATTTTSSSFSDSNMPEFDPDIGILVHPMRFLKI